MFESCRAHFAARAGPRVGHEGRSRLGEREYGQPPSRGPAGRTRPVLIPFARRLINLALLPT